MAEETSSDMSISDGKSLTPTQSLPSLYSHVFTSTPQVPPLGFPLVYPALPQMAHPIVGAPVVVSTVLPAPVPNRGRRATPTHLMVLGSGYRFISLLLILSDPLW